MHFTRLLMHAVLALLPLGLFSTDAVAQVPQSVGAVVVVVGDSGDPLRIVEFRPRSQVFKGPYTVVRNVSRKPIAGFRLKAAIIAPSVCVSETLEPTGMEESTCRYSNRGFEHTAVPIGGTARVYWNLLGPSGVVWNAKGLGSSYEEIQVSVEEVEFEDGTVWKPSTADACASFSHDLVKLEPADCQPWKAMNKSLAEVTEVWSRPNAPSGYLPNPVPDDQVGFVYSCRILGHAAVCPVPVKDQTP